ncbi:DoxX family protein [Marinomonas transparens]|uniref:DoxX family protein n=1 Tax=Marinomonas transparens TaxID=2795388 RepID=A0A934N259_9GAMM|nr:DoxX family protein [Marinomonas transparens]MBJ7538417.1 DoxX family protein [Marinomonas transparens]
MNTFKKYGFWAILGLTALAFLAGGVGKLMGVEMMHQSFATLGLPVFFGYFIGACEIAGAIGIFIKKLSSLAAVGLGLIMAGAMYYHLMFDPQGFPVAALLFVFSIVIFFVNKKHSVVFGKNQAAIA